MKIRVLAASATLAAALSLGAAGASAAVPTPAATRALQYLAANQQQDGSTDGAFGETADYTLGAAFHGIDPTTLKASPSNKSVYDYFTSWAASSVACSAVSNTRDGNTIGKLVQVVVAGRLDPANFAGRNLLADLEGPAATTGGAYDATTGTFQDCASYSAKSGHQNAVYAQANAILGLEVGNNPAYPVSPAALQHLRSLQDKNGGFATFGTDNTSATAMALMAFEGRLVTPAGAPADPTQAAALAYLHTQQDPKSGGFTYSTDFATASDPDSDALVVQALVSAGENPASSTWSNAAGNALSDMASFQDAGTGGFAFSHGSKPDAFTTSEVPAGLDQAPFPDGRVHFAAVTSPTPPLPSPSASVLPALPRAGRSPAQGLLPWALLAALVTAAAPLAIRTVSRRA